MTRFFFALTLVVACFTSQYSFAGTKTLVSAKITTGAGSTNNLPVGLPYKVFQAYGSTSASTGACDMKVQVSSDATNWIDLGMISLSLTTAGDTDFLEAASSWPFVRGNVLNISGTNAACSLIVAW